MFSPLEFKERCPKTFWLICGVLIASVVVASVFAFSAGAQRFGVWLQPFIHWPHWLQKWLSPKKDAGQDVIWTVPKPKSDCADKKKDRAGKCPAVSK